jgi:hypothetical protein
MTIRSVRIYLEYQDKAISRDMNRAHFGVMYWLGSRLERISNELRGAEVKGIDVVNVYFGESATLSGAHNSWKRVLNSFEYKLVFDVNSLKDKEPAENIKHLMPFISEVCASAPWPQVRAIGSVLQRPLTSEDAAELEKCLSKWAAVVDKAVMERKRRERGELH